VREASQEKEWLLLILFINMAGIRFDYEDFREIPALTTFLCASPIDAALHDAFGKVNKISSYQGYGPDL